MLHSNSSVCPVCVRLYPCLILSAMACICGLELILQFSIQIMQGYLILQYACFMSSGEPADWEWRHQGWFALAFRWPASFSGCTLTWANYSVFMHFNPWYICHFPQNGHLECRHLILLVHFQLRRLRWQRGVSIELCLEVYFYMHGLNRQAFPHADKGRIQGW